MIDTAELKGVIAKNGMPQSKWNYWKNVLFQRVQTVSRTTRAFNFIMAVIGLIKRRWNESNENLKRL